MPYVVGMHIKFYEYFYNGYSDGLNLFPSFDKFCTASTEYCIAESCGLGTISQVKLQAINTC